MLLLQINLHEIETNLRAYILIDLHVGRLCIPLVLLLRQPSHLPIKLHVIHIMPIAIDHPLVIKAQLVVFLGGWIRWIVPAPAIPGDEVPYGQEDECGVGVEVVVFPLVYVSDLGCCGHVLSDAVAACVDEPIACVRA